MQTLKDGLGSLLLDPKYTDLEIRCDGRSYYIHRLIVCSKSKVLARECDGEYKEAKDGVIEHTVFDCLTLERMLQFIYGGDYTIKATTRDAGSDGNANVTNDSHAETPRAMPPHLRHAPGMSNSSHPSAPKHVQAMHPVAGHVYVYAIAVYYEIDDLKALAVKKFTAAMTGLTMTGFVEVIKVIYSVTTDSDTRLRNELQKYLLEKQPDWLSSEAFTGVLLSHNDLHEFTTSSLMTFVKQCKEQVGENEQEAKRQTHTIDVLQLDLKKALEDLKNAQEQAKTAQSQLSLIGSVKAKLADCNQRHEKQIESLVAANRLHESDLDQINKNLALATNENKALCGQNSRQETELDKFKADKLRLEREVLTFMNVAAEHAKTAETNAQLLKQNTEKLKTESARAIKYIDVADNNLQVIKLRDSTIRQETARADNATAISKQIIKLVNGMRECSYCRQSRGYLRLAKDDRCTEDPRGSMLRCTACKTRFYGDLVQ